VDKVQLKLEMKMIESMTLQQMEPIMKDCWFKTTEGHL